MRLKHPEFNCDKSENINIIFFIQHKTVWNSLKSVYQSMVKNQRINVSIVLIPFIHNDASILETYFELKTFFIQEKIPFINYNFYSIDRHCPDVVFIQNPYEETRPKKFRIAEITKYGTKICYVPYALDIAGGLWHVQSQFNLPIHNAAWKIFAISNIQKDLYAKYCDAGCSHVLATGHPKFDNLTTVSYLNISLVKKIAGRKVILWTPHFSVGNPPTRSTYNIYHQAIFEEFKNRNNLFLYIRPHPLFFKAMINNNIWNAEDEVNFRDMIKLSNNMALDDNADYLQAFSISDALMADAGSFLLEYLPSSKPILYLHHPEGLGLYDASLEELYYKAVDTQDIISFIDMVAKSEDPHLDKRRSLIPEYLYGLDGKVGERIVEHIIEAFDKGDLYAPTLVESDDLQKQSLQPWQNGSNSFLAPDEYYKAKATLLDEVFQSLKLSGAAIDIGCGNGTFTFLLANYLDKIDAFDASYSMICQAREKQSQQSIQNIEFIHAELKDMKPFQKYDLVSCMEVTSKLSDDLEFLKILQSFRLLIKDDGYLLLIDSLSTAKEQLFSNDEGYVAKYRNISDYKYLVEENGFELVEEHTIKIIAEKELTNNLFVFRSKY